MDELLDIYYKNKVFYRGSDPEESKSAINPLCGDRIMFYLENDLLVYQHRGCILSNCSAAIFCNLYVEKKIDKYINNEIFLYLNKFPFREKCLKLPILAYNKFLAFSSA